MKPSKSHSRKPDPDEPWRYVCRECKGQVNGSASTKDKYTCSTRGAIWTSHELFDRKKGRAFEKQEKDRSVPQGSLNGMLHNPYKGTGTGDVVPYSTDDE